MALFNTLKQILTPYASKINVHTEEIEEIQIDVSGVKTDLENEISEINERLVNICGVENLVEVGSYVNGQGINANGEFVYSNALQYLDNIPVVTGEFYRFGLSSLVTVSTTVRIHGYNENGEWVQQIGYKTFNEVTDTELAYYIPDNVVSIKISMTKNQGVVRYIFKKDDLQTQIETTSETISVFRKTTDLTNNVTSGYIATNVSTNTTVNTAVIANSQFLHEIVPVFVGDKLVVNGRGGNASRTWAITDSDFKLLSNSPASTKVVDKVLYIHEDGYVIFNALVNEGYSITKTSTVTHKDEIDKSKRVELTNWIYGYVVNKGTVGSAFTGTKYTYSSAWRTQWIRVKQGEKYYITSKGGSSAVGLALFNYNNVVLEVSNSNATLTDHEITISEDGYMIVNALVASAYKVEKIGVEDYALTFKASDIPGVFETVTSVAYNSSTKYTYDEIVSGYDALASAYPTNISKTVLGEDASNTYNVYRYDFIPTVQSTDGYQNGMGAKMTADDYPVVFMDACLHGNEPPCARALLNLMEKIYSANGNNIFAWLRNNIHFIIVPVSNPYGYVNNTRGNSNGVDLNRNFTIFWENGSSDSSSDGFRGASPLSEVEDQYIDAILRSLIGKRAFYYNWHTHGVFTSYEKMTCFSYPLTGDTFAYQRIANDIITNITDSGHLSHDLPLNSGFIGIKQINIQAGTCAYQANAYGIPSAIPEVMYKYYDGSYGIDYSEKINCMNVEYMLLAVALAYKVFK